MDNKIYQSCGMPITKEELLGTNKDGKIIKNEAHYEK